MHISREICLIEHNYEDATRRHNLQPEGSIVVLDGLGALKL
jgi:hypothetical protein